VSVDARWRLECATKTKEKALKVHVRFVELLAHEVHGVTVEHDVDIPGFAVRFGAELHATTWEDAVFQLISAALRTGERWMIHGDAKTSFSVSSCHMFIPGVQCCEAEILLDKELQVGFDQADRGESRPWDIEQTLAEAHRRHAERSP
jgi:hypothetical protein